MKNSFVDRFNVIETLDWYYLDIPSSTHWNISGKDKSFNIIINKLSQNMSC